MPNRLTYHSKVFHLLAIPLVFVRLALCSADAESFQFDDSISVETYISSDVGHVNHMATDNFLPGNILFSDVHTLKTTDRNSVTLIVGSLEGYEDGVGNVAEFNWITGFYQLNKTHVLLSDSVNCCLRLVNRLTNETSSYVGNCTNRGYKDGVGISVKFQNPQAMLLDIKNTSRFLLADEYNGAVRTVERFAPIAGTFYSSNGRHSFVGMTQSSITGDIFLTTRYSVYKLSYHNQILTVIAGQLAGPGFSDGPLLTAKFNYAREIILTKNRTQLLVADRRNHRLRLLDLLLNVTTSICTDRSVPDRANGCGFSDPYSLFVMKETLLIGEAQSIRSIAGSMMTTEETDKPKDTTAIVITALVSSTVLIVTVVVAVSCYWYKIKGQASGTAVSSPTQACVSPSEDPITCYSVASDSANAIASSNFKPTPSSHTPTSSVTSKVPSQAVRVDTSSAAYMNGSDAESPYHYAELNRALWFKVKPESAGNVYDGYVDNPYHIQSSDSLDTDGEGNKPVTSNPQVYTSLG